MVVDPITQAAEAIARSRASDSALTAQASTTIPVSFGHRVVKGFTIWVSQKSAPSLATMTDTLSAVSSSTNVSDGDVVTIGGRTYTFQTTLTNVDGHVAIGSDVSASLTNLRHAINADGGTAGTDYASAMTANADVTASEDNGDVLVTQKASSTGTISVGTTSSAVTWATSTLQTSNTVAGQLTHQTTSSPLLSGATTATFAVAFGYSLLPEELRSGTKVLKLWADDELIYDSSSSSNVPTWFEGLKMTVHPGLPEAEPDNLISADMGALTPGFQNLIYVVFEDYPLETKAGTPASTSTGAPVTVTSQEVLPYPGFGSVGALNSYNAGLAWFGPGAGTGNFWLKKPSNIAFPEGGFGGYYISWINDSQSRTGKGGGYNSMLGTVTPYPVDIGNGTSVIAGNAAQDATVQFVKTEPGTTTTTAATEPSYRTTLPTIKAEIVDAVTIPPSLHGFTLLDNLAPIPMGLFGGIGGFVDWDFNYLYQWTNSSGPPASFFEHVYSLPDQLELMRFSPVSEYTVNKDTPLAENYTGVNVTFGDTFAAHDRTNKLAFGQFGLFNSDPMVMIDLTSGQIKGAYGLQNNNLDDVDFLSLAIQQCGDCVVSTDASGRSFGVVTGQFLGTQVAYTQYNPGTGAMTGGGHVALDFDGTGAHRTGDLVAYPLVDRADIIKKYGVTSTSRQDWFVFATVGQNVYRVQGTGRAITGYTAIYSADFAPYMMWIDPSDYNLVLFKHDAAGNPWMEKLQIDTTAGAGGPTPVFMHSLYNVQLPADIGLSGFSRLCLRESRYLDGRLVYPAGNSWITIDTSSGATLNTVTVSAETDAWVYDSVNGMAYALGSITMPSPVSSISFKTETGGAVAMSDVLTWLAEYGGYALADVFINGITDTVLGGVYDQKVGMWSYLQNLAKVFGFDFFESEGKIKFVRGTRGDTSAAAYTIDIDTMTTADGSSGDLKENLITTMAAPSEVANAVEVGYMDADYNYQANTKTFQRARYPYRLVNPTSTVSYETYLAMTGSEALQRAATAAFASYAESTAQSLKLPQSYSRLEPGDAINIIINGTNFLAGMKELVYNLDWSVTVTAVNFNYKTGATVKADRPLGTTQSSNGPSDSLALAIDTTLPVATDDPGQASALLVTGVQSFGQSWWDGAAFNVTAQGETSWTRLYFTDAQTPYGRMAQVLPATPTPFRQDTGGYDVISVSICGGAITGTDTDLFAGTNAAYVGQPGRWELIYYESLTWVNSKRFTVSNVLRGRRGTDVNCNNHADGDYFIPFNRATMQLYPADTAKLGKVMSFAAVGVGTTKPATMLTETLEGNSLKPWAVRYVTAVRL